MPDYDPFLAGLAGAAQRLLREHQFPVGFPGVATIEVKFAADLTVGNVTLRQQQAVTLEDRALALLLLRRCRVDEHYTGGIIVEMNLTGGTVAAVAVTARRWHKPDPVDVVVAEAVDAIAARPPLVGADDSTAT